MIYHTSDRKRPHQLDSDPYPRCWLAARLAAVLAGSLSCAKNSTHINLSLFSTLYLYTIAIEEKQNHALCKTRTKRSFFQNGNREIQGTVRKLAFLSAETEGPFLEGPETFSSPKSRSEIPNLLTTELFYSYITNRGSLHTKNFKRIHLSIFKTD